MDTRSDPTDCNNRTLRLEEGLSFDGSISSPDSQAQAVVPVQPVVSPDGIATSCSRTEKPARSSSACRNILLGQVLSVLIATMSMSSASLSDRGVNLPCFVNFLNYGMITVFFFLPKLIAQGSLQLTVPWWRYALYALVDVEANTLAVLAFRYTSITSVTMLDAFSIPAVMVLSCLLLRARYTGKHLVGVALCLGGLALTILSDLQGRQPRSTYPQALKGDVLCIVGAALYAGSNVMQEDFVKNHDRVEFLGMAGLFGFIISGVQTVALEREALAEIEWTPSIVFFILGYALSLTVMYSWTSLFLQAGDAAMFNLSLLTSDVYALIFAFVVEHVTPNWLYFLAFTVIFGGLICYHAQPLPTKAHTLRLDILHGDAFDLGESPGQGMWLDGRAEGVPGEFFKLREPSGNSGSTYCGSGEGMSDCSITGSLSPTPDYDLWSL